MFPANIFRYHLTCEMQYSFHLVRKGSKVVSIPAISLFRSISSRLIVPGVSACIASAFSFSPDFQSNG